MHPASPLVRRRTVLGLAALAVGGVGLGLTGCGTAQTGGGAGTGEAQGRAGAAGDTLFVSGFQWGPPTSFNPLGPSTAFPCAQNQMQLIYETLLRFNLLDGSLSPGLARELQEPEPGTFLLPLHEEAAWRDGTPVTAADVVFTFQLAKETSVSYSNVWEYLAEVTAEGERSIRFVCKEEPFNPGFVRNAIATVYVLPQHVFSKLTGTALTENANDDPVGSGPFQLDTADQTQINLKRADSYWGSQVHGTPPMTTINHPIFKTGNDGDIKLESGEIDASQQFTPQIWKMWEDKQAPVGTWLKEKPYYIPGNRPMLIFNLSKKGLSDPAVRRAIAYSINYPNIATTAMSDYSDPASASLIIPSGYESKFYDEAAVQAEGWSYDKDKAVDILENELQATKGSDGIYSLPDGTRLGGWKLITPTGWTDWNTACEIVAKSAQDIGIGISTEFPQAPTMIQSMQNGDFDLCMYSYSGVSPASPWNRFRDALDARGVPAPGKTAFYNYGRFSSPDVPDLLDAAAAAGTDDEARAAYAALDKIYRQQIPCISLMYRPLEFYEFNSSNWENFPTEENPYA
ncbi:MAG TPA: ABC transporter substrate-binding protein, partial [Microlunatus sp.]|nr:ABC transporter substrate-binding protein [Microlunatus sp.]